MLADNGIVTGDGLVRRRRTCLHIGGGFGRFGSYLELLRTDRAGNCRVGYSTRRLPRSWTGFCRTIRHLVTIFIIECLSFRFSAIDVCIVGCGFLVTTAAATATTAAPTTRLTAGVSFWRVVGRLGRCRLCRRRGYLDFPGVIVLACHCAFAGSSTGLALRLLLLRFALGARLRVFTCRSLLLAFGLGQLSLRLA